jgi:hypothetical protein
MHYVQISKRSWGSKKIMDIAISTHSSELQKTKIILKPEIYVSSGIREIDEVIHGFKAEEITYVCGRSIITKQIPYFLCATTYHTFHSDTLFIDGGCSVNPYNIARYAQKYELSENEVLNHVHISRAFTVYQLNSLIHDHLEDMINKCQPQTLIINAFPRLYNDPDVSVNEAEILLKTALSTLKKITKKYQIITVLTNNDSNLFNSNHSLNLPLHMMSDEIISINHIQNCSRIDFINHQKTKTVTSITRGQLCLKDFGMVI